MSTECASIGVSAANGSCSAVGCSHGARPTAGASADDDASDSHGDDPCSIDPAKPSRADAPTEAFSPPADGGSAGGGHSVSLGRELSAYELSAYELSAYDGRRGLRLGLPGGDRVGLNRGLPRHRRSLGLGRALGPREGLGRELDLVHLGPRPRRNDRSGAEQREIGLERGADAVAIALDVLVEGVGVGPELIAARALRSAISSPSRRRSPSEMRRAVDSASLTTACARASDSSVS